MNHLAVILVLLLAPGFFAGCATTGYIKIPRAPDWIQPADAQPLDPLRVLGKAASVAPAALVSYQDSAYTPLSLKWVRLYTSWTWEAAGAIGLRYTLESFDCENFAGLFNEIARKKAGDAGIHTAPLIARVTVRLSPTVTHAIVGVATDDGLWLIEPQPDAGPFRLTRLADYPHPILRIEL